MFPKRRRARAERRASAAALLVFLLDVCACGTTARTTAKPKPSLAPSTTPAAGADAGVQLLDWGLPPRQKLDFDLKPASSYQLEMSQELLLLRGGVEQGAVLLEGPLQVRVLEVSDASFQVAVELGPVTVRQRGDTAGISWPSDSDNEPASRTATARFRLGKRGQPLEQPVADEAGGALVWPLFETLLHLHQLPASPVGAGARWRTRRAERDSGVETRSEHELLELGPSHGTLRVWREQSASDTPSKASRARGEWRWSRDRWPFTGIDRTSFDLPGSADAVVSVTFQVTELGQ